MPQPGCQAGQGRRSQLAYRLIDPAVGTIDPITLLQNAASKDAGIDKALLAGLLYELGKNVDPQLGHNSNGLNGIDPRMDLLRQIVLGREIQELSRIAHAIDDPEQLANAVGRILPTAIAQATQDPRLGEVLAPTVEKATQTSIRKNPRTLVDILYPLILPAIRKSIGERIDETFQSLNETLKHSLTWQGVKWRIEAWRTGTSFAEVVLKHSLVYQVEHAFLIHRNSGLLIAHVTSDNAASEDPQLVSSMLSAIQEFVQDSFKDAEHEGLDTINLGALRLWTEVGPVATLVAVIRGNPPEGFHSVMRDTLLRIHEERSEALNNFDGSSENLADVEAQLRTLVQLRQEAQEFKMESPWRVAVAAGAIFVILSGWSFLSWLHAHRWENYVTILESQAGIIVVKDYVSGGKYHVTGLRDPLAADPDQFLADASIDADDVVANWQPYQSLEPQFVLMRLQASLNPPATVNFSIEDNKIIARGMAAPRWIEVAQEAVQLVPAGGPPIDISAVQDISKGDLNSLREEIQSKEILFNSNESIPSPGQEQTLDELARQLNDVIFLARNVGVTTRFLLTGHSDSIGKGTTNLSLSVARAESVRALLKKRGVDPELLAVRGAGQFEPLNEQTSQSALSENRRVSFTVSFE